MEITLTITSFQIYAALYFIYIAILLYIYTKIDGEDRVTHMRHDVEINKEWFRMLAKRGTKNGIRRI
jgi:hypothetical protein